MDPLPTRDKSVGVKRFEIILFLLLGQLGIPFYPSFPC